MSLFHRPRQSILDVQLRCPRCRRVYRGADWQIGYGFLRCWHPECQERWWVMVLSPGAVQPQIEEPFDGFAGQLIVAHRLPATVAEPMFWQISLSKDEAHNHARSRPLQLFHAIGLLKFAS